MEERNRGATFKDSENPGVTSVTSPVCWLKVQYIIKCVKYVTTTCENLFVQTQWFNCPVTLLYSICRTLYVIVWRRFFYYLLIIFVNLINRDLTKIPPPICLFCPTLMMMMMIMCNVTEGNICIGIKDYITTRKREFRLVFLTRKGQKNES